MSRSWFSAHSSGDRGELLSLGPLRTRLVTSKSVLIAEGGVGVGPAELRLMILAELGGVLEDKTFLGGEGQKAIGPSLPVTADLILAFVLGETEGVPDAMVGTCPVEG